MSNWKKIGILILAIGSLVGLAILIKYYRGWLVENSSTLLGWLLFFINYLYYHLDWFYWICQKAKYTILNPDTTWDLTVRYKLKDIEPATLNVLQEQIGKAAILDRPIIRYLSSNRFEIRADELSIEVYIDMEHTIVDVIFSKIPVSFRGSQRTIEKRILPILEAIEKELVINTKNYWLKVYFGRLNPYFGLYMKRLHQKDISEMYIKIGDSKNDTTLELSQETLTIMTESLSDLTEKARKYLTLSEMPT